MYLIDVIASHPVATLVVIALGAVIAGSIRIANQYERAVVFRLGKFSRTAGPGIYIVWFLIEWQTILDLRTVTAAVAQQEGITRDNVPIKVETVVWYRIVDPERAVMEVRAIANAVEQVALTTLRTVLGQHTLDDILKAQDTISELMQKAIDSVNVPWPRRPKRCARSGRVSSRPRLSSRLPSSCAMRPKSSCRTPRRWNSGAC